LGEVSKFPEPFGPSDSRVANRKEKKVVVERPMARVGAGVGTRSKKFFFPEIVDQSNST
jgi:hypothetical protein